MPSIGRVRHITRRVVLRGTIAVRPGDLDALARYYRTDKSSDGHGYARLYQRHLGSRRRKVRSVLEIGVGGTTSWEGYQTTAGGQSLRMWCRYFPKAIILGVDIHPKAISAPRIRFEQGDQSDPDFLARLRAKYGPFDLIIDDGSHIGRHVAASFGGLWNAVKPGGFYVVEDLQASYHPDWEGGPPGTPGTAAAMLKECIDSTLKREGQSFSPSVAAMHIYGGIAFLERPA